MLLAAALLAQELLDASKHPWLAWKPGAAARYRVVVELGPTKQEGGVAYTLGDDGLVKVVASHFGKQVVSEQREALPSRTGAEGVTVGGAAVSCGVWASRGLRGGLPYESRLWLRPEGGSPLRMTSKIEGQEDLSLSAAALDETVRAARRDFLCVRLEGRDAAKNHQVTAWYSPDVPGGLVKMLTAGKAGGHALSSTLELVDLTEKR